MDTSSLPSWVIPLVASLAGLLLLLCCGIYFFRRWKRVERSQVAPEAGGERARVDVPREEVRAAPRMPHLVLAGTFRVPQSPVAGRCCLAPCTRLPPFKRVSLPAPLPAPLSCVLSSQDDAAAPMPPPQPAAAGSGQVLPVDTAAASSAKPDPPLPPPAPPPEPPQQAVGGTGQVTPMTSAAAANRDRVGMVPQID